MLLNVSLHWNSKWLLLRLEGDYFCIPHHFNKVGLLCSCQQADLETLATSSNINILILEQHVLKKWGRLSSNEKVRLHFNNFSLSIYFSICGCVYPSSSVFLEPMRYYTCNKCSVRVCQLTEACCTGQLNTIWTLGCHS